MSKTLIGSKALITINGKQIVVQGVKISESRNIEGLPIAAELPADYGPVSLTCSGFRIMQPYDDTLEDQEESPEYNDCND